MTTQKEPSLNTKLKLAEAMNQCMRRASVETITIKEICNEANCSRQTFYRCFIDKYDLINWYFDRILHESFDRMGQGITIKDGLLRKFSYIKEEYLFFHAAFSTDTQNNLREHDFQMIFAFYQDLIKSKDPHALTQDIKDILEMYCYSSVYMTVKWVLKGTKETTLELAETMLKAMPKDLMDLFKKLNILE